MRRSFEIEILDHDDVAEPQVARAYRDLTRIHRVLGDTSAVVSAIRRDPLPVARVLDVGCGRGGVLREVMRRLDVDGVGVDLKPPREAIDSVPIVRADAVRDPLPEADVAFSMHLAHHLSSVELARLIQNVGRSCRRFILLDLVRHPLPLALFRVFVAPLTCAIVQADGQASIRRAFTPIELRRIALTTLAGTGARLRHSVAPLYMRQILDIAYAPEGTPSKRMGHYTNGRVIRAESHPFANFLRALHNPDAPRF